MHAHPRRANSLGGCAYIRSGRWSQISQLLPSGDFLTALLMPIQKLRPIDVQFVHRNRPTAVIVAESLLTLSWLRHLRQWPTALPAGTTNQPHGCRARARTRVVDVSTENCMAISDFRSGCRSWRWTHRLYAASRHEFLQRLPMQPQSTCRARNVAIVPCQCGTQKLSVKLLQCPSARFGEW